MKNVRFALAIIIALLIQGCCIKYNLVRNLCPIMQLTQRVYSKPQVFIRLWSVLATELSILLGKWHMIET